MWAAGVFLADDHPFPCTGKYWVGIPARFAREPGDRSRPSEAAYVSSTGTAGATPPG
jgi:hypothetical protein